MNCFVLVRAGVAQPAARAPAGLLASTSRRFSPCSLLDSPDRKPRLELCDVAVARAAPATARQLVPFLHEQLWPREPSVCALWMDLRCDYLRFLTDKYAHLGDRFCAYERLRRTGECRLVGVAAAGQVFPWQPAELEEWAHGTRAVPERSRMYFMAHCYRSADLWRKYCVDYIYEVEALATAAEAGRRGVATLLLRRLLREALLLRHPLILLICTNKYAVCEKCGMKKEWSMEYSDFVDDAGQSMFYPRGPHYSCSAYVKRFDQAEAAALPCLPPLY